MSEQRVSFSSRGEPALRLEGRLLDGGGAPLVVSHPHPLHGGTMDHPVVEAIWRAGSAAGFRALRYNFRGVGGSTGRLTPKSPLPLADLGGAIDFLGKSPVTAVGYSYGARVTLHALAAGERLARAFLVGLPTRLPHNASAMSNLILGRRLAGEQYRPTPDLDLLASTAAPITILAGELDPLFDPDAVRARGFEPLLLPGVNHFFSRRLGNQSPLPADLAALTDRLYAGG
ncbi:MAG: alpha/beta hydrolase [Planctomycetaceae bacterium]